MRKLVPFTLLAAAVFFLSANVSTVQAGTLKFSSTSSSFRQNDTVSVNVMVDARTDQVAGADVYVTYDPAYLQFQSVTAGDYFPLVTNNPTTGKVYISAVVENSSQYKTGEGKLATINFKALQAGSSTLTFACDLTKSDTSKIVKSDINATNVIECNTLSNFPFTIAASAPATGGGGTSGGTNNGTGTGNTGGGTNNGGGYAAGGTLPRSGVYENVAAFALPGIALVIVGLLSRLLLK